MEDLAVLDIRTSHLTHASPDDVPGDQDGWTHRRAARFHLRGWELRPWYESGDEYAFVEWDEECGWVVVKGWDSNHGMGETRYVLGLGLVPEASNVALRIELLLDNESPYGRDAEPLRNAVDYDPSLEEALAAYLPP
ncbi:hypothetical protein [Actinomadura madurae]|nr:hypothetical protein [Actinomadura madurae]MCP9950091.1 hypothetical protein [Actinomadura madurae]MCP9966855.1 hypothetical protein [Actinomadura madurae]MCP9979338.1 hypothetical protein [Actinomadura madurae]MCQ0009138.1 hypothetical protein [Actinomadura madurae]MCQ0015540.1 hypothetical protein [Actinomadura madurae]